MHVRSLHASLTPAEITTRAPSEGREGEGEREHKKFGTPIASANFLLHAVRTTQLGWLLSGVGGPLLCALPRWLQRQKR